MAAAGTVEHTQAESNGVSHHSNGDLDPFMDVDKTGPQLHFQRYSSRFELDNDDIAAASSPSQVKRVIEAHLLETERRLQDTHKLGTSLLQQQSELQEKLHEVERQQDDAVISPELKQRLASLGREHDDVSREIARSLLGPKSRAVSGEEKLTAEGTTLTSQATGSPTKISAPNRRSRNQPVNHAGDLQFAADLTTSLLAQVRQLQAAVAERDELLKTTTTERSQLEQDVQLFAQRLRSHDEHEQRYKDENWNLEAQNHELISAQRDATEKERRINAALALVNAEKVRLLADIEEARSAHGKVAEEHEASKKSHEAEVHSLKRDLDAVDSERSLMQARIDDLAAQNQELAKAMSTRYRDQSPQKQPNFGAEDEDLTRDLSTPEHSPPPSPTKGTPRHGGLESETLKSSLHHAHRMNQNLKNTVHRERTEKIELKRMLQEARDELEQRRNDPNLANGSKKSKTRNEVFKKPLRPDMLGSSRRARTDVEVQDEDWEDHTNEIPGHFVTERPPAGPGLTDLSDAYQTAHETESNFDTADERQNTESEAFETGAESLAGDSTDDLTETESTATRSLHRVSTKNNRPSVGFRSAGNRDSYLSTASTSAGEEEDDLQTPIQSQSQRFRLRNSRPSASRHTQIFAGTPDSTRSQAYQDTPESARTQTSFQDSPATVTEGRSPPVAQQSLFAELEGIHDTSSNFSTPARSGMSTADSTPGLSQTPSKTVPGVVHSVIQPKPAMVDSATMTEAWQPEPAVPHSPFLSVPETTSAHSSMDGSRIGSIGAFPLPPTTVAPPTEHVNVATQYTPQKSGDTTPRRQLEEPIQYTPSRGSQDSPVRAGNAFITPPKTVWDTEHESAIGSPDHNIVGDMEHSKAPLGYSGMLHQDSIPLSPERSQSEAPVALAYSTIVSQQTYPIAPPPSMPPKGPLPAIPNAAKQDRSNTEKITAGMLGGGLLAGAAAALGLTKAKDIDSPAETARVDDSIVADSSPSRARSPLQDVPIITRPTQRDDLQQGRPVTISSNDQSSQTMLSSEEIDRALLAQQRVPAVVTGSPALSKALPKPPSPQLARSPELTKKASFGSTTAPMSPPLRPSSASSHRLVTTSHQHPPLPPDYKTNIARANSQVQSGPQRKESNAPAVGSVMGPPALPASAMRRAKTPTESMRSPSRDNATPRVAGSMRQRAGTESQLSRRSSMSSFASEIDERFNIRTDGHGYESAPGTDPRMIAAITQTMIGEYLWKYTRKTGSKEMSNTRHKRYFWVHPYTKTLYWSANDPSTPGAKEGTSRSVPIESIRVVSDDNPMPPGLHRKSLEITTPSRKVRFTAATGQRHETWFNALTYLLLRGEAPDAFGAYSTGGNEITRDDVEEFRASAYDPRLVPTSRQSMSSYNSRTTAGTSKRVSGAVGPALRQPLPSNIVSDNNTTLRHQNSMTRNSPVPQTAASGRVSRADSSREAEKDRNARTASVSRISRMMGSITGRTSRQAIHEQEEGQQATHSRGPSRQSNSIYDASVVSPTRDSAEEMRQEMLRQDPSAGGGAGLENVRACCDGKHDVSTLVHSQRPGERQGTLSSMSDRINRSMSKRV